MRCCELKLTSLWLPRCEGDVSDPAYALEISRTHFAVDLVHSFMGDLFHSQALSGSSICRRRRHAIFHAATTLGLPNRGLWGIRCPMTKSSSANTWALHTVMYSHVGKIIYLFGHLSYLPSWFCPSDSKTRYLAILLSSSCRFTLGGSTLCNLALFGHPRALGNNRVIVRVKCFLP